MKFGLFYLFSDFGDVSQQQVFDQVLREVEYGEELGYESVWLPEHHFAVYGMLGNPLVLAAAVAQRTKRMEIGTAVVLLPFQHPIRFAEDAALVDVLSEGRLLLGIGRGYQPPEFKGFGVPQEESSAMFQESFEILRRALSGEKFAYDGTYWQIQEETEIFPKPVQQPHPPFYLASISLRSIEVAGRLGMSLLRAPQFSSMEAVAENFDAYTAKLAEHGHDPAGMDQPISLRVYVAPTEEEAKAETEHALWFYHLQAKLVPGAPGTGAAPRGYENYPIDPAFLANLTLDDVWERGTIFGTPDQVIERLKQYLHTSTFNHLVVQMRTGGMAHDKIIRSMELFATEVMPALREEEARLAAAA